MSKVESAQASVRHFLLVGRPGSGKTTLVKKLVEWLSPRGLKLAGFLTEEIRVGRERKGFQVINLSGERAIFAHVGFSGMPHISKYGVDIGTLEKVALIPLRDAYAHSDLIIIDEIGGMELLSPLFRSLIREIFMSEGLILATMKERTDLLKDPVFSGPQSKIYRVNVHSRDALVEVLSQDIMRAVERS